MYSFYQDTMDRRQQSLSAPTASSVRSGWTDTITETLNQQVSFTQNHRKRTVETINVAFGGEKRFSSSFLDYGFNYSGSSGTEDRVIPTRIVDGRAGFRFDRSRSAKLPSVEQISGPDILDLNNQRISTLNFQDFDDTDTIKGAHVNWRRRFVTAAPTSLKMGLRYRGQEREREQLRSYYVHVGADGVAGLNPATRVNDDNVARFIDEGYRYRPAGGLYERFGTYIDPVRLVQDWRANPSHYTLNVANTARDSLQFNGAVSENICAAYLMGDINLGRLDILGGFRVEDTYLKGTGVRQEITPAERARRAAWVGTVTPQELERRTIAEWSNLREEGGNYRSLLPSLHFKYSLSNNMLGRLSYSTGIGRPNFIDLLRTTTVNHDTMTVVAANPNLRPQYADNFDFSLEYYFEPAGFVSAGVFLKEIKDFIYGDRAGVVPAGEDNGFDGDYVGYDLSSQFNGGSARVRGFELAYQQRLVWLPGFWKGLGLMANYTRLESRGNYDASGKVTGAELDNFVPESMNLGLSYAYHKWDIRVKMNYRGGSLYAYSSNPLLSNHRFAKRNYDLNLKYNWATRLSFFVDVINVFNTPLNDTYLYVPKRNRFTQVFTTAIKAGVSGRF
jgi:TonB-dependent receptor